MRLFLGIDGGQSSTTAWIGDDSGRVIATGTGGPCNHAGAQQGRERFLAAISDSLQQAGYLESTFESVCLGLSGGPEDKEALTREAVRAKNYVVTHDAMIALAGATAGGPGVIVIAGTGSIAFGRNAGRQTARAGGWGYIFGDEGAAFDLVRRALRAALRAEEGWGSPTALRDILLSATGASSANQLLHRFYTDEYPRARIAALAPVIDEAARSGDEAARELINNAAQELALLAGAVRRQLFIPGEDVDVRHVGGVFRSEPLLQRFRMLVEMKDGCRVSPPVFGPAAGALMEAYSAVGLQPALQDIPGEE